MNRLALIALILAAAPLQAQFTSVRVQVIDRGQADGILIRTPNSEWVVIDAGTNGQQANAMRDSWGVDEVALAIVSHRHFDHQGGMDSIINAFDVGRLVMNSVDCPNRTSDNTMINAATARGVPIQSLGADTLTVDGVDFIILPPDRRRAYAHASAAALNHYSKRNTPSGYVRTRWPATPTMAF